MAKRPPLIGMSLNILPPDPHRDVFRNKELQYAETSLVKYVSRFGAIPVMVLEQETDGAMARLAATLDGLLLTGGADVCPKSYGQDDYDERWPGDYRRDQQELALTQAMVDAGKPVLGVCRGHQMINVFFGGTLHQDNVEGGATDRVHRDSQQYDHLQHEVDVVADTELSRLYGAGRHRINSIHHQSVKDLGKGLTISARSDDGLVEGIEWFDGGWVMGVQWHPEWIDDRFTGLLDPAPLMRRFLEAVEKA